MKKTKDYDMTDNDICAQITIETSSSTDVLVKINDIALKQNQLLPLLDENKYLDDKTVGAYINCIRDQAYLQDRNDGKSYIETPLFSGLLKRDGKHGIAENNDVHSNFITKIARDYLTHELVLDSKCWKHNRTDLTTTLQGLEYHFSSLEQQQNISTHNWEDLRITTWTITEQLREPMQTYGTSCGLFMLKYMEKWIGDALSQPITQEHMTLFRSNLVSILIHNENKFTSKRHIDNSEESKPSYNQTKYQSLMSVLSKMEVSELISGLCNYIKSIDCAQTLRKVWVQTSKPYSIRLTLQILQGILKESEPMYHDCFNIITIIDFGRHPNYRKKLNILIPTEYCGTFILIILDQETKTLYILDPAPLNPFMKITQTQDIQKKIYVSVNT
uniref:Ubiquitin-like protease family profile domain-containing protein n=1 Tax=Oryza punctata TaxID=4537 RepID=A0A0E0KSY4_ORYPU